MIAMLNIKYTTRVFPYPKFGSVCVRVRWNGKKNSVDFTTGDFVELDKWDSATQRAKTNTKHIVRGHEQYAWAINKRIGVVLGYVEKVFHDFELADEIPDSGAFRAAMRELFLQEVQPSPEHEPRKSMILESLESILSKFIAEQSTEESWREHSKYKYTQAVGHLIANNPGITIDKISKATLIELRTQLFKAGRHNASIARWMDALKAFFKWASERGYEVNPEAINFKHRVVVPEKRIIYLQYEELLNFYHFQFPEGTAPHLIRARDLFCFMAFTSLRYSDMAALKKADVATDHIELYTIKTRDKILIPILSFVHGIINKYKDTPGEYLLPVPSNQKLNQYIKEAAKIAGLNRVVVETFFVDKEKHEIVNELWETLSCHDARRTFVCCSLRMGIPPNIVMKCTGHAKYENMKPYIDVADEVVAKEMGLWETTEIKREIIKLLDGANEKTLKKVLKLLKQ